MADFFAQEFPVTLTHSVDGHLNCALTVMPNVSAACGYDGPPRSPTR